MHNDFACRSGIRVHRAANVLLVVVLAGTVPVGCARFHGSPISATKVAADFEARSLADAGLKTFLETNHVMDECPRRILDLNALSLAAFYFQPDLDVARAQLVGARAAGITAGARPNPTVSFDPTYDTTTPPPWILGLSFDIPLETMGKRGCRIAQAAHKSDAARFNLATTAWQVRSRVRKSLLGLYAGEEFQTLLK